MATKIYCRTLQEIPSIAPATTYRTLKVGTFAASAASLFSMSSGAETDGSRRFWSSSEIPMSFYSERILTPVTISGTIAFNVWTHAPATFTGRLRARLYKVTTGGSNVESLICTADATTDIVDTVSTLYAFTGTPTSTALVLGERLILRFFVTPVLGSFGTGNAQIRYNEETAATQGNTWIELTETVTFYDNAVPLYLRRTADTAIGDFYDLLPVLGSSAYTTAQVATTTGGTEIQWTRTPTSSVNVTEVTAAAIASTLNATTYASASYTPVVNRLYLLPVVHSDTAPESTVPTVTTTNGLTFVQVGSSIPFGTIASPGQRLTLFRAMKASGLSAGTHTVTLADAGTGCAAILAEATGVVTTGTNGADAVINIATANADASANPAVTLAAFTSANNGTFACFGANTQTAPTIGSGWTALSHPDYATPAVGTFAEWTTANDTTADCVLASSAWAGIAVELVAAPGDTTVVEWISGRVKAPGFYFASNLNVSLSYLYGMENNALANARMRVKLSKRAPDGTETLIYTYSVIVEFATSLRRDAFNTGTATPTGFVEDDRLILRAYIYNSGTMAGGYVATLAYDGNSADPLVDGNSSLLLLEGPLFKAEGDAGATGIIPSGGSMSGISNGQ